MRIVLLPNNNALSHVAKCLALRERLLDGGHEIFIAVARKWSSFLDRLKIDHKILPDIQEADGSPVPTFAWFKPARFQTCVRAETEWLREIRPDRVLGVFRFTAGVSARLAGVPHDSLTCGCMVPECQETIGFAPGEDGCDLQADWLRFFRGFCASQAGAAIMNMGLPGITDILQLMHGERTFLWDFPEFLPLAPSPRLHHIGPLRWHGWPRTKFDPKMVARMPRPIAIVAFGTAGVPPRMVQRTAQALLQSGWSVVVAAGGQAEVVDLLPSNHRLVCFEFAPLDEVLPMVDLLVCHGGQGIVFESLHHAVPVLVIPFQPEQAHNGICLERIGCGQRLFPPRPYRGGRDLHLADLESLQPHKMQTILQTCLGNGASTVRRREMSRVIRQYDGVASLALALESP